MNSLYFWKTWNSPYKQLYFFLLSIFIFLLLILGYTSYNSIEGAVKWETETQIEPVKVVIDQFARNLMNFTVESESYYALDKFVSAEILVNTYYSYFYLFFIILGVLFILTTFSFLDLYWYMAGMLLFLCFLFNLKIDLLQLFGSIGHLPTIALFLVYSGISFLFNSFYKSVTYLIRFCSFLVLTIIVSFIIQHYSEVATPFLYLANFGSMFPLWITVIFILVIGYDIIKGLLYVVSSKNTAGSKNSLLNFFFASLLYLINVFLLLMKKMYVFDLGIIYLNPFLLLCVSSVLGIWMFKKRSELFSSVLPFAPAGAFVYISLAIISLSGASYALLNGNIGMVNSYEYIIIYGHMFLGFIFLIYVLVNFLKLFDKNVSIYEIVYQPVKLTFWAVPAFSITIAAMFLLYQKKYPYNLALSGYYTNAGDVMVYERQYPLAFEYYNEAISYDYPNHRANYSIAALASTLDDKETAKGYFENALLRDPSVQSYIGLSNNYVETGELFKALFQVQEGLKKFPEDGRLYNNLGVLYHKINLEDSSAYCFFKAKTLLTKRQVATSNILYLLAKRNLFEEADSIIQVENYVENISFQNNKLAILNQLGRRSKDSFIESFVKDSVLNANTYAYLVNSNINSLKDTSLNVADRILTVKNCASNESYKDQLTCQLALKKYYTGNRFAAIQDMTLLNATSSSKEIYSTLLGYWMFEQEQNKSASDYFKVASEGGNGNTQLNYVLTALLSNQKEDALFILYQLTNSSDKNIVNISNKLISSVVVKSEANAIELNESDRLQYFLIAIKNNSIDHLEQLYKSFTNDQAKVYAGCALCRLYIDRNELEKALSIYSSIKVIQQLNPYALGERNYTQLLLNVELKDVKFLSENATVLKLNSDKELLRSYFKAVSFEFTGDSIQANQFYLKSLSEAPYVDEVVLKAVNYLSKHGQQQLAYNYLVEIVQNNPTISTQKAYLELCLDMYFTNYAESTLEALKGQISASDYAQYQQRLIENQQ